jgi:formylglycine-generating enzyme required for sulfatase activity
MEADASALLEKLRPVNPVVGARCLVEGGAQADDATSRAIATTLVDKMTDQRQPAVARVQAGDALARLGDPRPGVGVHPATGLPEIVWCKVPAGPFLMGSANDDEMALGSEKPQHRNDLITKGFLISRYPITNAQFAAFAGAGGYRERRYWTEAGWRWKEGEGWTGPYDYGEPFSLPNHPVVGVSWYEAVAFCHWLTEQLRQSRRLSAREQITLPTESQWEKAARGTDGRIYPWGSEADPNRANYRETGIGTTSAVGCFPGGASPYGVEDLSGNVWEWSRTKWEGNYKDYRDDNDLRGDATRMLRGGSWSFDPYTLRSAYRNRALLVARYDSHGFRCARGSH